MYVLCQVLIFCMLLMFLTNSIELRVSYGVGTHMHQNLIKIEICALLGFYTV